MHRSVQQKNHSSIKHFTTRRERGQILVLVAAAMVALLVATGLAVDGGMLLVRKAQLARAVDAAALAGVTELSSGGLNAANIRGQQMMAANDFTLLSPVTCATWGSNTNCYTGTRSVGNIPGSVRYQVQAGILAETYFMRIFNFNRIPLTSTAMAEYLDLVDLYASDTGEIGLVKSSNQSIFGPAQNTSFGDPYTPTNSLYYNEIYGAYTYRIRIPEAYPFSEMRVEILDPDTGSSADGNVITYGVDGTIDNTNSCNDTRYNACTLPNTPWSAGGTNPNRFWLVRLDEVRTPGGNPAPAYPPQPTTLQYDAASPNLTRTLYRLFYLKQLPDGNLEEVDLAYYIGKADTTAAINTSPTGLYTATEARDEARATNNKWVSPGVIDEELMPAFTDAPPTNFVAGEFGCVFEHLAWLASEFAGTAPAIPTTPLCATAEPPTFVESCEDYRAANYGPYETGGDTLALGCEGDEDFLINLDEETPDIFVDPGSGIRDIYLQVRGLSGASENGYEFWAGPPRSADVGDMEFTVPSDVNARHLFLLGARRAGFEAHRSYGIQVTGMGRLPMNSNVSAQLVDIPLAYIGPEFAGQALHIQMFDPDAGAQDPVIFYFDTIPESDWHVCFDDAGNDAWSTCSAQGFGPRDGPANIPLGDAWQTPDYSFTVPSDGGGGTQPFYGGRLYVRYRAGGNDTYGWKIQIDSRPYLVR
jgi:hypothetical protein